MDTGGNGRSIGEIIAWLLTWGWVLTLSAWGGAVSYFHTMRKYGLKFSLFRLGVDVWTSAFVGVLTYLLCQASGISGEVTAAMVGVSGHMGTRALFMLEQKYERMFSYKETGTVSDESPEKTKG